MGKLGGRKKCGEAEKTGKGAEFKAVVEIGRKLAEKVQAEIRQKSGRGGDNREGGVTLTIPYIYSWALLFLFLHVKRNQAIIKVITLVSCPLSSFPISAGHSRSSVHPPFIGLDSVSSPETLPLLCCASLRDKIQWYLITPWLSEVYKVVKRQGWHNILKGINQYRQAA